VKVLVILIAIAGISACASTSKVSDELTVATMTDAELCLVKLTTNDDAESASLNSEDIRVVNWNIQKGGDPEWTADLESFSDEPQLMVFQEAVLGSDAWETIGSDHYRSFAPGHRTSSDSTGLMTLSSVEPLSECNLVAVEPWLRSPKATLITEYGLTDTDQTLLVVNIHAINFTFGTSDFEEQVERAFSVVDEHDGPVLLSGDFNTWNQGRADVLREIAEGLGFETLKFDEDHRKRAFGQTLDHIYSRGLQILDSSTADFGSSDHNPMSVRFSL
jgi:endonuclease/exonuclease/phosphatase (EEP) superfamily protein YafD